MKAEKKGMDRQTWRGRKRERVRGRDRESFQERRERVAWGPTVRCKKREEDHQRWRLRGVIGRERDHQ